MDRISKGKISEIRIKTAEFIEKYPVIILMVISLVTALAVFSRFIFGGNLFVYTDCNMDTYLSYIPINELIVNYFRNGMTESLMNFSLGLGEDMLSVIQYACDPFTAIVVIVGIIFGPATVAYTQCYAQILTILASAYFCYRFLEMHGCRHYGNIIGSYCFAFSGYMLGAGQHYQFAVMVFFTAFSLYMLERYIQDDKRFGGVVLAFFMLSLRGIYHLVMIGMMLAVYYLFRMIALHSIKDIKHFIIKSLKILFFIALAFGMSLFVSMNGISDILSSGRVDVESSFLERALASFHWNDLSYDYNIFLRSLSEVALGTANNYRWYNSFVDPHMFMGIICIFCVVLYIYDLIAAKGNVKNRILCMIAVLLIVFSVTNSFIPLLVHVFAYATYRFTVVLTPFLAYCIADQVPKLSKLSIGRFIALILTALTVITAALFSVSGNNTTIEIIIQASIVLVTVVLICIISGFSLSFVSEKMQRFLKVLLVLTVIANMTFDGFVSTNVARSVWTKEYYEENHDNAYVTDALDYIKNAEGDEFYRIETTSQSGIFISPIDYSYMKSYRSTSFYSSTLSEDIYKFKEAFGNPGAHIDLINWYAAGTYGRLFDIPAANALGIKYILSNYSSDDRWIPVYSNDRLTVYRNPEFQNAVRVYTHYITESDIALLDSKAKQIILSQAAVVEDSFADSKAAEGMTRISKPVCHDESSGMSVPMNNSEQVQNVWIDDNLNPIDGSFSMSSYDNGCVTWSNSSTNDAGNCFISYNIFANNGCTELRIVFSLENGEVKEDILIPDNQNHSIDLPEGCKTFTIYFPAGGYIFERMKLLSYESLIGSAEGTVTNKNLGGSISVDVNMPVNGLLYLPIEYNTGWHTSENDDIIKSNYCFSGIFVNEGMNKIELEYENALFRKGLSVSVVSFAVYIGYYAVFAYLNRKQKKNQTGSI